MKETAKCKAMRAARGDFVKYLHGNGIDIGAGDDVLEIESGTVHGWDLKDGDAQLLSSVVDASLDFVYSSHCLEHMRSVEEALSNWTRVLKQKGYLYLVVPDYILYEKLTWPSVYNTDHKQSFSFLVTRNMVGRSNHYHLEQDFFPLLQRLGYRVISAGVEDAGFNYNTGRADQTLGSALAQLCIIAQKV